MTEDNGSTAPVPWHWIDTPDRLESARESLIAASILSVDTEYDSLRYFREKLCLIQVCDGKEAYLFDPLAGLDLTFLGSLFGDPAVLKILHAGDNDIRLFNRDYGFSFRNIFDTHRAASVLGCQFLSLSYILQEYMGIEVPKSKRMQRSKWETRPLTEEQLLYAARDAYILFDLHKSLEKNLSAQGLLDQASEVFASLENTRWRDKIINPGGFRRFEGFEELSDRGKACLERLYQWRFQKARETNMARFLILADEGLMALCRRPPEDLPSLEETGILSSRQIRDFGREIIDLLSGGNDAPEKE
ncbi:MAG TPA: ribonuclease D [Syntrophales bacterium]|nr:ribonuclease D [Syntrophales bacterium]HQN78262.1 ribonuclease D [Syntrophales bacterium]HQQ27892.1 ribonuclease D [Syntrophales bacterium]